MIQQPLIFAVEAQASGLTCSLGEPWEGRDHPLCRAALDRACAEFDGAVARGEFDREGYAPAERKAQAKKNRNVNGHEYGRRTED